MLSLKKFKKIPLWLIILLIIILVFTLYTLFSCVKEGFISFNVEADMASGPYTLPNVDASGVKLYDNNESLYLDLQNGRVDVIMTNPMKAYLKFLSKSEGSRFEFKSPVIDEEKFFGIGVGIGMRKGQADLKNKLNNALKYLINTGELETYAKKIFPFKLHQDSWGS